MYKPQTHREYIQLDDILSNMSTLENTSFIDSELSTGKTKREDKDGTEDAAIGVRHIFVFLGK